MKTKQQKRAEAEERRANYKPNPKDFGIRQKVKAGLISAKDARKDLGPPSQFNAKIGTWLTKKTR